MLSLAERDTYAQYKNSWSVTMERQVKCYGNCRVQSGKQKEHVYFKCKGIDKGAFVHLGNVGLYFPAPLTSGWPCDYDVSEEIMCATSEQEL